MGYLRATPPSLYTWTHPLVNHNFIRLTYNSLLTRRPLHSQTIPIHTTSLRVASLYPYSQYFTSCQIRLLLFTILPLELHHSAPIHTTSLPATPDYSYPQHFPSCYIRLLISTTLPFLLHQTTPIHNASLPIALEQSTTYNTSFFALYQQLLRYTNSASSQ